MAKFTNPKREGNLPQAERNKSSQSHLQRYSPLVVAFFSGGVVLLLEILGARILAPYMGTSFSVWVNIIGTILGSLSAGYYLGGLLADRNQKLLPVVLLVGACACALVHFEKPLLPSFGELGLAWGSLLAAILLFAPASIVLGMVSPFLLKIAANDPTRIGRTSGSIFAASTLGSIAGTFLGGFWLIPHFPISLILTGMVVVLVFLSAWCAGTIRPSWVAVVLGLVLVTVVEAVLAPTGDWSAHTRHVFEQNSRYYNIRVNDLGQKVRVLLLDGQVQSGLFLNGQGTFFPYTELSAKIIRSLKPAPQSALVIGGGGYTMPEIIKNNSPGSDVTVIEIDPAVTTTAERFFLKDPQLPITTLNEDGRVFLNQNQRQFDLLYTDAYSAGLSIPPFLATREAVQQMKRALKPDGMIVFNILSARTGKYAKVYESLLTTIHEVFPQTAAFWTIPAEPDAPQNVILIASNGLPFPEEALQPFESSRGRETPPRGLLLTDDYAPTDYLVHDLVHANYPGERQFQ
jgi:spermidine synthase